MNVPRDRNKGTLMKTPLKTLLLLLIAVLLVLGGFRLVKARKAKEAATTPAKEYAVFIHAMTAQKSDVTLTLPYIALSRNDNDAAIASKISARVLEIRKSGERVKKGDVLVRLDDRALRSELAALDHAIESARDELKAAQATLENLRTIHRRTAGLLKLQGASEEQYQNEAVKITDTQARIAGIRAKIAKLQADRVTMEDTLSYTRIHAPIDGIVSESLASVGDLAMPGKPLLKLSASRGSWLLVRLPDRAPAIEYGGKRIPLHPLHSTFNGLNEFRADLDENLPAGNRVPVSVIRYQGPGVLLPMDTLLNLQGKTVVFVIEGNRALPRPVTILASGEEGVLVPDTLAGRRLALAKPDILLRLLSGYPFLTLDGER